MTTAEVSLDPMTGEEFAAWLPPTVRRYARGRVEAGDWPEQDALEFAKTEFRTLLPEGLATDQQHLFTVRETAGGAAIGMLWIGMRRRAGKTDAFVYNVEIDEERRGKGYGRATMLAGAQWARESGARTMSLHVFGSNKAARALYESLGFIEANVNMMLPLTD